MGLLTSGYWHATYWAKDYWHEDYWQDYGAVSVQPNAFVPKAVHSAYFPVAVQQGDVQSKAVIGAIIIPKGVKG